MARLPLVRGSRCTAAFGVLLGLSLAQPALAQRSGLLLGIDGENGARTLWITRDASGRVAVAGELQRLLVPRADGFWWVDVDRRCDSHDSDPDDPDNPLFIDKEAFVVVSKVDGEPLAANPNYSDCDALGQQILTREKARKLHLDDYSELYCLFDTIELTYVSGRYISYRNHSSSTEFCNPAKYTSSTYLHVEDFNQRRVSLLDAMTPAERTSLLETWERETGERAPEESPDESWAIEPIEGEWRATFATSGDIASKGQSGGEFTVTGRVPSSILKQDSAAKPWRAELGRRMQGSVQTVFVSPRRDWLIASSGQRVLAFALPSSSSPSSNRLGEPIFTLELRESERVVMGEWATGSHVRRWTAEIARLQSAQEQRRH